MKNEETYQMTEEELFALLQKISGNRYKRGKFIPQNHTEPGKVVDTPYLQEGLSLGSQNHSQTSQSRSKTTDKIKNSENGFLILPSSGSDTENYEDFCLKDKMGYHNNYESSAFFTKKDVKEFIKRLKKAINEEFDKGHKENLWLKKRIDKLTGDLK